MSEQNNAPPSLGDLADIIQKATSQLKEFDEKYPAISQMLVTMMDIIVLQGKELAEHHDKLELLRNCHLKTKDVLDNSGITQLSTLSADQDLPN